MDNKTTKARIRMFNDAARACLSDGIIYLTPGIIALPQKDQTAILERVRTFDNFTPANDPHEEHDFGVFTHNGREIMWKIDYYDSELQYLSPDPADLAVTRRTLTIMLAGEY